MPYRNPMAYGYRKRKGYSRYGRRVSKHRRYGYRRSRFVRAVKRIARHVVSKDEPIQATVRRGYYGITGGVYGTAGDTIPTPNVNRMAVWGATFYGNRASMNAAYQSTALAGTFNVMDRQVVLEKYTEKHTIQNTCLFPIVLNVYKHYFKDGWKNSKGATNDLLNQYTTIAAENALYNPATTASEIVSNFIWDGTAYQNHQSAAMSELWKANLQYNQANPSWVSNGLRSFLVATPTAVLGTPSISNDAETAPALMVRPFGMVKFKMPQLTAVKFYKKMTKILAPGQQISVEFTRKHKTLDVEDIGFIEGLIEDGGYITYMPGACGYTFEAHGLMSHDTTVTPTTGQLALPGVARSSFSLCGETVINYKFRNNTLINFDSGKFTTLSTIGATVAAEGRAGVQMDETGLNT